MPPVLIVGGSTGLGLALARECVNSVDNDQVTVASRHAPDRRDELASVGVMSAVSLDIADPSTYEAVLARAGDAWRVYMTAGVYGAGPLAKMDDAQIAALVHTHVLGFMQFVAAFHRQRMQAAQPQPYDLVVIGSTLAHVPGKMHAVLAGCKAAKVHFARTFALELERDIPGSKVFIFNPWGMKTDFFAGTAVKTDSFMDPTDVAKLLLEKEFKADRSRPGAIEFTFDRAKDGSTLVLEGAQPPKV